MALPPDTRHGGAFDRPFLTSGSMGGWRPLLRQLDDFFNEAMELVPAESRVNAPACDCEETEGHYLLNFDMPGLDKKNIDIELRGNQLFVSGEKKQEMGEGRGRFTERRYGRYERILTLPDDIKTDRVEATYNNGVLSVAIPKAEEAKPIKVAIGEEKSGFFQRLLGRTNKEDEKKAVDVKGSDKANQASQGASPQS